MKLVRHICATWTGSLVGCLVYLLLPLPVGAEEIRDFLVTYTIDTSSIVQVEEVIRYDFGTQSRRGILRTLRKNHIQSASVWYRQRSVAIELQSVTRNGTSEPFTIITNGLQKDIRIGTSDVFLTGLQTYVLRYTLYGALGKTIDELDFYWNVTGDGWSVPIGTVRAVVNVPTGALMSLRACYYGDFGSYQTCQIDEPLSRQVRFRAENILPGQGLTIVQSLSPDVITALPYEPLRWWVGVVPLLIIGMAVWARQVYRELVLYRPNRSIVVEYHPYNDLPALFVGILI